MIDGIDKVTVTAHYDDDGRCRTIFVYLNDTVVTSADVTDAVRAVFRPEKTFDAWNSATISHQHLQVRVNGTELFDQGRC